MSATLLDMTSKTWFGLALVLSVSGCSLDGNFVCTASPQCVLSGAPGFCESNGACSFPSPDCPSGRRFGHFAIPGVADQCTCDGGTCDAGVSPPCDGDTCDAGVPDLTQVP